MSKAFTREQLARMTPDQVAGELDDINAWVAGGAVDGQAPTELKRPDGHVFTRAEIESMSAEAVVANTEAISRQLAGGGIV